MREIIHEVMHERQFVGLKEAICERRFCRHRNKIRENVH